MQRLARARKAPLDLVMRARMIELSWAGVRVPAIAAELACSQKTVRRWLHRFNQSGLEGLEDLGGQGRKRPITEEQRSQIISLVKTVPPGRLRWEPVGELWAFDEAGPPEWTLDSLAAAAQAEGIEVGRSQVRRILLAEGVRRRRTRPLHPPTRQRDGDLRRRAGAGDPTDLPARTCLVTRRAPDQSGTRLHPRTGENLSLRWPATLRRPGRHHDRSLPQQRLLAAVPPTARGRQPARGDLDRHRQPLLPQQPVHPDLAEGPPPHPSRLHPRRRLLAQPPGRLVAHLPQSRPRRPVIRQPRRHHIRHNPGHRPAQLPRHTLDLGQTRATNPSTTTPICIHPLRNAAVGRREGRRAPSPAQPELRADPAGFARPG